MIMAKLPNGVFVYDDTFDVPLIVAGATGAAWPSRFAKGSVDRSLPTVAEFLDLAPNPLRKEFSLWPLIEQGRSIAAGCRLRVHRNHLYPKTFMNWSELRGMRTDRWKFILAPRPELYDLEQDPVKPKCH